MGTPSRMNITISRAWLLLTGLSNLYRARTNSIWTVWVIRALTMPRRNNDSEARILLAVVAASPGTMRTEGTYTRPKAPNTATSRYRNPATLAVSLIALASSSLVIVLLLFCSIRTSAESYSSRVMAFMVTSCLAPAHRLDQTRSPSRMAPSAARHLAGGRDHQRDAESSGS